MKIGFLLLWWCVALGNEADDGESDVVVLTKANFKELVLESETPWIVEFFAPWCGHCQRLAPEWKLAATALKGKVHLGTVDATAETELASEYGVNSYPTIKVFRHGDVEEYTGPREAPGIEAWTLDNVYEGDLEPIRVPELTDQETFETTCGSKMCVIAVLPDILDTQAAGRNELIDVLVGLAKRARRDPFAFAWTAARTQPKFEDLVGIAAYPAVVAISLKHKRFALMVTAYTRPNLGDFIMDLMPRPGKKEQPIATVPFDSVSFDTITAWDGKDGELPQEEEFDLSELGIEIEKPEEQEHEEL